MGGVIICLLVVIIVVRRSRSRRRKAQDPRETSGEDAIDYSRIPGLEPFSITDSRRRPRTEEREKSKSDTITEKTPAQTIQGTSSSSAAARTWDSVVHETPNPTYQGTLVNVGGSESGVNDGPANIPLLLERLNRAMAMLPPGGVSAASDVEDPPEYAAT